MVENLMKGKNLQCLSRQESSPDYEQIMVFPKVFSVSPRFDDLILFDRVILLLFILIFPQNACDLAKMS